MTGSHLKMLKPLGIMLLATALISGCHTTGMKTPAPAALSPLIAAMNQRLDIASDVAQSKFYSGKPVLDTEREQLVIANAEAQASTYGLGKTDVRQFMTDQIEANKSVQYARLKQWHDTQPPAKPTASLTTGIRGRLDTLQPLLMQRYAAFVPFRHDVACPGWVHSEIQRQTHEPIQASALARAAASLCMRSDS